MPRHVDGDRESDSLVAARVARKNGGIDANQMPFVIDQCAAGVARVNRRVGLNKIFQLFDSESPSAGGTHDAGRNRLAHAEWIANRQYDVADLDFAGVGQRQHWKVRPIDLEDRDVGPRIGAHYSGFHFSFIMQRDGNIRGALHHVIVRQNVAFGADDDARSESFLSAILWNVEFVPEVISKKLAEKRIHTLRHSCAVCFTTFEDEILTTAGRTRFSMAEYPRPAAASERAAVRMVGAGFSKGNLPNSAARKP